MAGPLPRRVLSDRCGRRWPLDEVEPCPWPGQIRLWDPEGSERVVCRSHAAHPSAARLLAGEEDP